MPTTTDSDDRKGTDVPSNNDRMVDPPFDKNMVCTANSKRGGREKKGFTGDSDALSSRPLSRLLPFFAPPFSFIVSTVARDFMVMSTWAG